MKDLPIKDQALSYLSVEGWSNDEIALALNLSQEAVRLKLTDERIKEKMGELEARFQASDPKKVMQDMLPAALEAMREALEDPSIKPQLKIQAARDIIEHNMGKPKQTVEHQGSLVRAFLEKLNQPEDVIPVEFKEALSDNPNEAQPLLTKANPNFQEDPVDSWINQNLKTKTT